MTPDLINGLFEFAGSVFTWMNVRQVWRDKGHAGIYVPAIVFFTAWGWWNLFYYPSLGQYWSLAGGLSLFSANCVWVYLLRHFGPKKTCEIIRTEHGEMPKWDPIDGHR